MRLGLLVGGVLLSAAAVAACSSTGEPAQSRVSQENATDPSGSSGGDGSDPTTDDDTDADGSAVDGGTPSKPVKDGGTSDANAPADAAPVGPAAFTKAEIQTLVDDRCSPCHTDFASGGMSLANDFTTNTVEIASTQVPSMKRIKKGDHGASYLWHKVNGTHTTVGGTGVRMPKNGAALSAIELDRLAKYIDAL